MKHLSTRRCVMHFAGVCQEGHSFVRPMLQAGKEGDAPEVKDDEFVSPTHARDLAEGISEIVRSGVYGVYHVNNSGSCSWYEFTREISEIEFEVVPGSEYPLPAAR